MPILSNCLYCILITLASLRKVFRIWYSQHYHVVLELFYSMGSVYVWGEGRSVYNQLMICCLHL